MTIWLLLLVPLLLAPVVLLVAYAGCGFQVSVPDPVVKDAYGDLVAAEPSLVAYWRLGETVGTTAADSAAMHLDATYHLPVTLGAPGVLVGPSYTGESFTAAGFAGGGYVERVPSGALQPKSAFTLETWVQFAPNMGGLMTLITSSDATGGYVLQAFPDPASKQPTVQGIVSAGTTIMREAIVTSPPLATGGYHHLVLTYDAGQANEPETLTLYVDGVPGDPATSDISSYTPAAAAFRLGIGNDGSSPLEGELDEVAFYNTALSASTVTAHFHTAST